ncbi:hypothetical protein [Caballeronia fortuita]|uniref:hypothetical protein n=1 Tax=Caballeronia fortuita TaxID=1777138 RepID=UPI0012FD1126|nr:hypothetical protein [Caballeronia fortuita]
MTTTISLKLADAVLRRRMRPITSYGFLYECVIGYSPLRLEREMAHLTVQRMIVRVGLE